MSTRADEVLRRITIESATSIARPPHTHTRRLAGEASSGAAEQSPRIQLTKLLRATPGERGSAAISAMKKKMPLGCLHAERADGAKQSGGRTERCDRHTIRARSCERVAQIQFGEA